MACEKSVWKSFFEGVPACRNEVRTFLVILLTMVCFVYVLDEQMVKWPRTSLKPVSTQFHQHIVICEETGRLGNLMFTYASTYGIAKRKNMSVAIDESNPLLNYFKLDAYIVRINSLQGYKVLREARACDFDENLITFSPDTDIMVKEYLQSWKYFLHVDDLLRRQFQFPENVTAKADSILSKIREDKLQKVHNHSVVLIGLHYRRGDKIQKFYQDFGYQMAPMSYLKRAMAYFRLFHENVVFVVASDSIDYVKENLQDEDIVFLGKNSPIEDLAIMSRCDHLISTVGSFGWWAGFLNKGTVLYYKYPAREGSDLRKVFGKSYANYFHLRWTGMA